MEVVGLLGMQCTLVVAKFAVAGAVDTVGVPTEQLPDRYWIPLVAGWGTAVVRLAEEPLLDRRQILADVVVADMQE